MPAGYGIMPLMNPGTEEESEWMQKCCGMC